MLVERARQAAAIALVLATIVVAPACKFVQVSRRDDIQGTRFLRPSTELDDPSVGSVVARIKRDNMASQQLFVGQGFVKESEERGVERYLYELSRARAR